MKIRELLQQRAKHVTDARALLDRAETEGRDLSAEEREQYDKLLEQASELKDRADRLERQEKLELELAANRNEPTGRGEPGRGEPGGGAPENADEKRAQAYRDGFRSYLRGGIQSLTAEQRSMFEQRALQSDVSVDGGYLVPPVEFVRDLIKFVDDIVYIRQWATTQEVMMAQSLGVPSLDADPADADWTSELATGAEDSAMKLGARELNPHPLAKRLKVSHKLLRQVPSVEQLVRERLGYKFGVTQEKGFLVGNGDQQPLGVFTASNQGISTGRDVSAGNTTTAPTFDGLINAKYTLKPQYWPNARWLKHRDVLKEVAKIKDGNGQYIWRESVRAGEPDRLLNLPVFMSEFAPATLTTGLYVGILGDFRHYWIVDALQMTMQRLVELYAETNQVGFIGRLETDGMPVLEEAFVRVQLA